MKKYHKGIFPVGALISLFIISSFILGIITVFFDNQRLKKVILQNNQLSSSIETATKSALLLDYIVITETPIPTPTKKPTPVPTRTPTPIPITSSELEVFFLKYSSSQSIDKEILKKIASCESKLNPQAINGPYVGLFQFSANSWISTRRVMNENQDLNLRFNPEESIKTAAFKIATSGVHAWPNCNQ